MEEHAPVEQPIAVIDTSSITLDSREGIIQGLKDIAICPKSKPMEKLRALDKIAELKGFKIDRQIKDLRFIPTKELNDLIRSLVLPTMAAFGVESGTPEMMIDANPRS